MIFTSVFQYGAKQELKAIEKQINETYENLLEVT